MLTIYDGLNQIRLMLESGGMSLGRLYHRHANVPATNPTIWVWEGRGGNQRRRAKFPEYKLTRRKPQEDMFAAIGVFQTLMQNCSNAFNITVEGYEGDDVVASLVELYREKSEIFVYSTDKDFRQFYGHNVKGTANQLKGHKGELIDDQYVRLFKTLVGDPSDNIPGIPKFGAGKFAECDKDRILDRFQRGHYILEEYDGVKLDFALWSQQPQNSALLQTMWEIVGFYHVPVETLNANMKQGKFDPDAAQIILNQFLME